MGKLSRIKTKIYKNKDIISNLNKRSELTNFGVKSDIKYNINK